MENKQEQRQTMGQRYFMRRISKDLQTQMKEERISANRYQSEVIESSGFLSRTIESGISMQSGILSNSQMINRARMRIFLQKNGENGIYSNKISFSGRDSHLKMR